MNDNEAFEKCWPALSMQVDIRKDNAREVFQAALAYARELGPCGHLKILETCYCVCHSSASSRPACIHCHPEQYKDKADPYVHCSQCQREAEVRR